MTNLLKEKCRKNDRSGSYRMTEKMGFFKLVDQDLKSQIVNIHLNIV